MNDIFPSFVRDLDALIKELTRTRTALVNRQETRDKTRDLVKKYFMQHRVVLLQQFEDESTLSSLDAVMQEIIDYCNRRTTKTKYVKSLYEAKRELATLEAEYLRDFASASVSRYTKSISTQDEHIVKTLFDMCPTASLSYQQALLDLVDTNRQSWRGPVAELRECMREILDQLAPDNNVTAQQGFKLKPDRSSPTMKQKVVFILSNRCASSSKIKVTKSSVDVVEEKTGAFVRTVYDSSSASTHGTPTRDEVISIKNHIALVLSELLQLHL